MYKILLGEMFNSRDKVLSLACYVLEDLNSINCYWYDRTQIKSNKTLIIPSRFMHFIEKPI